jgi:hypothetical protein
VAVLVGRTSTQQHHSDRTVPILYSVRIELAVAVAVVAMVGKPIIHKQQAVRVVHLVDTVKQVQR